MTTPQEEIARLRQEIRIHDRKYYVQAAPEISDLQYDRLVKQLKDLEAAHPDLITADSPTQRVGDAPVSHLSQVAHRVPMLSIDNTYGVDELKQYGQRVSKWLDGEPVEWVVELKIDGVAASLRYENGRLVQGVTRGNGTVGDDITHNVRTVADVPLKLIGDSVPEVIEVRGEVYMTNSELVRLNEQQITKGEQPFKNTRNVTAGCIRLLDPRTCAERNLRMFCHGIGYVEGLKAATHVEFLDEIRGYGLSPTPFVESFPSLAEAIDHCEGLIGRLHDLDFEVDGLVLKVNRFDQRQRLGATAKSPRWVIAYKFEKYEATTRLNAIRVQIGKTGTITPVAELEPVELAGTTVSRASLHNAEEIERKDIRVGDIVIVEKAGKIIPHVVRVEKHERDASVTPYMFPTHCPECTTRLTKDEGGVYIRCTNHACPAQVKERIRYFASRSAMDIEGLGDRLVDQLVTSGLVKCYADLYNLQLEEVTKLERMGDRSAQKLLSGIEASKSRGLARLLNALSIRHVGTNVALLLANQFGSMQSLQEASIEELSEIDEVGPVIAESVFTYLHSDFGEQSIRRLADGGVSMEAIRRKSESAGSRMTGKTFVVTGTLSKYSRDQIHEQILSHGGKPTSSISKKTDYLIAGDKAGSKLDKARKLGVKILSEEDFDEML